MNIFKILLLLCLGYVALTQKVEKTRNMLLIVTGLLAFCMFSIEGFGNITFDSSSSSDDGSSGGTITSSNNREYVFPAGFSLETGMPAPEYSCGDGNVPVTEPTSLTGNLTSDTVESAYPCSDRQKCKDANDLSCVYGYTLKSGDDDLCVGGECSQSDFEKDGPCCKPDFCDCLTKTDGEHINCNSGWVSIDVGKYIKKNSESTGWELTSKYWDEDNYKCWPMILEDLWEYLGIFSGKCVVPINTSLEELAKCEPPQSEDNTNDEPGDGGEGGNP